MKPSATGVAVFSGLAAVVAADTLPVDSIPLQCIKVCGPVVELTSVCDTNVDLRRMALKRRKVEAGVRGPRLHYKRECIGGKCRNDPNKRQFSVIRQAPTSFPPELVDVPEETAAARPTRIFPVIETTTAAPSTSQKPPPPPTDDTNTDDDADDVEEDDGPAPSTSGPTKTVSSTIVSSTTGGTATAVADESATSSAAVAEDDGQDANDWWMPDGAEEQCVCMNTSFDVARLTALCASCVDQTGDVTNNIDIIVKTCKFPDETYSRDLDKVAENVRVKATKPTLQMQSSNGAALAQKAAGAQMTVQSRVAMVVAAGVVVMAAMM